jgi:eukaryotic-like serine/threonine-protein kinase
MPPSDHDRDPVERLAEEFAERYRRGEHPALSEYTERYPEHAGAIRLLFPALVKLEQLKPAATEPFAGCGPLPGLGGEGRPERLGEYRIVREIGRGGMGVVYEAVQESLGRRVALKVLLHHHVRDGRPFQRFQREVRAAARLHHTNIVPVFGLGEHHGLPYYVMQFIEGLGLDEVLVGLRRLREPAGDDTRPRPDDHRDRAARACQMAWELLTGCRPARTDGDAPGLGRPYWLAVARIGIQAADALAHAHQQGTLHRDVKPANLLLDAQGTLWVTDFSLAKSITDDDSLTPSGDAVGTFRYMAPEGFHGQADARSDVYSLGLTLYELLTLRPAFSPGDRQRFLKRVAGDVAPPRKLEPGVPRDLETVVLKAIARDADHRYQTGAELADDLRRFVEDKPVRARRAGPVEQLRRWCRRNPLVSGLTAALVAVAAVSFVAVVGLWQRAESQRGRAEANAIEFLGQSQRAAANALEAGWQTQRAAANFGKAREVVDLMLTRVADEPLRNAPQMEPARRQILEDALKFYQELLAQRADNSALRLETGRAAQRVSEICLLMGRLDTAEATQRAGLDLLAGLAREIPGEPGYEYAREEGRLQLSRVFAERGQLADAVACCREAVAGLERVAERYPATAEYGVAKARGLQHLADLLRRQGRHDAADVAIRRATDCLEEVVRQTPEHAGHRSALAAGLYTLGASLERRMDLGRSEAAYRRSLAIYGRLLVEFPAAAEYRLGRARALTNLGSVLRQVARFREAEGVLRWAVAEGERLAADFPALTPYRNALAAASHNHALVLDALNRPKEAEDTARRGLAIADKLAAEFPHVAEYRWQLAHSLLGLRKILWHPQPPWAQQPNPEADQLHERAEQIVQNLVADFPDVPAYRDYRARLSIDRGDRLWANGRHREAEATLRDALAASERLARGDPGAAAHLERLAAGHHTLGRTYSYEQRFAEAEVQIARALALRQRLAADRPGVVAYRLDWATDHLNLARMRRFSGRREEAAAVYGWASALFQDAIHEFPELVGSRWWIGPACHREQVFFLRDLGKMSEAEAVHRGVLPLYERLAAASTAGRAHLAGWHTDLAVLCRAAGRLAEAEQAWRTSVELSGRLVAEEPTVPLYQSQLCQRVFGLAGVLQRHNDLASLRLVVENALSVQRTANLLHAGPSPGDSYVRSYYRLLTETLLGLNEPTEAARAATDLCRHAGDQARVKAPAAYLLARAARALRARGEPAAAQRAVAEAEKVLSWITGPLTEPADQDAMAWVLAMIPEPNLQDPKQAVELALRATADRPLVGRHWTTLGAACYRAGRFPAARSALQRALSVSRGGDGTDWFLLALVEAKLGRLEEARGWFDRAVAWTDQHKPADEELRGLREEAARLLAEQPATAPAGDGQSPGSGR